MFIFKKCEDVKNSVVALDSAGAENLRGNGHGIIKRGCNLEEFQGYFITDTEVKKLIKPFIKPKSENKPINEDNTLNDKLLNEDNTLNDKLLNEDSKIIDLDFIKNL